MGLRGARDQDRQENVLEDVRALGIKEDEGGESEEGAASVKIRHLAVGEGGDLLAGGGATKRNGRLKACIGK